MVALLVAVICSAIGNIPDFDGPLTLTFLLLDITPIIADGACRMTLVGSWSAGSTSVESIVELGAAC